MTTLTGYYIKIQKILQQAGICQNLKDLTTVIYGC